MVPFHKEAVPLESVLKLLDVLSIIIISNSLSKVFIALLKADWHIYNFLEAFVKLSCLAISTK